MNATDLSSIPPASIYKGRSAFALFLGILFLGQAIVLASAHWFDLIAQYLLEMCYGGTIEQFYAALVTTWSDGSYDTTYGYRSFGIQAWFFAALFAVTAIGLWRQRTWSRSAGVLLAAVGALEPVLRLATIEYLMPYSDSLGYIIDLSQARVALVGVSLPSTTVLMLLLFVKGSSSSEAPALSYRQFTLTHLVTATTLIAILLKHFLSLSQVYGMV